MDFIKNIFDYNRFLQTPTLWHEGTNVLFLALGLLGFVAVVLLIFLLTRGKGRKIVVGVFATIMLLLQGGLIVWTALTPGVVLDLHFWLVNVSLHGFGILVWVTSLTSLFTLRKKTLGKFGKFMQNVVLGVGVLVALMTFTSPVFLDVNREFFHFTNLVPQIIRGLMIALPLMFVISGKNKVRLKNIWMPLLGVAAVAGVAKLGTNVLLDTTTNTVQSNFFFVNEIPKMLMDVINGIYKPLGDLLANEWYRLGFVIIVSWLLILILFGVLRVFELARKTVVSKTKETKPIESKPEEVEKIAVTSAPLHEEIVVMPIEVVEPAKEEIVVQEESEAVVAPVTEPVEEIVPVQTPPKVVKEKVEEKPIVKPTPTVVHEPKAVTKETGPIEVKVTPKTPLRVPRPHVKNQWTRREELEAMTLDDLRILARTHNMIGYYNIKKSTLIDDLMESEFPVVIPKEPLETKILTRDDLEPLNVIELKELAKAKGLKGYYKMNRQGLVRELIKISK